MYDHPSRREQRELDLTLAAEEGSFSLELNLYKSEMNTLEKQGFIISNVKPSNVSQLYVANASWKNAYNTGLPLMVYNYINGIISTYPKSYVDNLAQELYITAMMVLE